MILSIRYFNFIKLVFFIGRISLLKNKDIIYGYLIKDTSSKTIKNFSQINNSVDCKEEFLWLHLNSESQNTKDWLLNKSGLPKIISESLLSYDTRPRVLNTKEGILINLRGLNLNPGSDAEDMVSLHIWITANKIITLAWENIFAINDIKGSIENGYGPKTIDTFLKQVIQGLTIRIGDYVSDIEDQVDEFEDKILNMESKELRSLLLNMRRKILLIRRYIIPQRNVLSSLQMEQIEWLNEINRFYIREFTENTARLVDELDTIKDRVSILQEELNNQISEQMNKTMYILSIISSIFLPLGFLTGLFGINIGGMPGVDSNNAFLVFSLFMIFIASMEYIIFKRNHWL